MKENKVDLIAKQNKKFCCFEILMIIYITFSFRADYIHIIHQYINLMKKYYRRINQKEKILISFFSLYLLNHCIKQKEMLL